MQPPTSAKDDEFGFYVALDGDTAVIGAPRVSLNGSGEQDGVAFVYQRRPAGWQQAARLLPSPMFTGAWFGSSITIEDNLIAVGAFHASPRGEDSGAVYLFHARRRLGPGRIRPPGRRDVAGARDHDG